jgi:hypothetical protein
LDGPSECDDTSQPLQFQINVTRIGKVRFEIWTGDVSLKCLDYTPQRLCPDFREELFSRDDTGKGELFQRWIETSLQIVPVASRVEAVPTYDRQPHGIQPMKAERLCPIAEGQSLIHKAGCNPVRPQQSG